MSNTFKILAGFLDRTEPEVQGRSLEDPPASVQVKLRQFARGELPEAEQKDLFNHLQRNRHWISLLADEVKSLRGSSKN
ncbi:MAG TPA: hypothetical protein VN281_08205 [Verrucomicrobiae bacterium]|nr:hypothetical protein [Verrucomicrobiae bacterium]